MTASLDEKPSEAETRMNIQGRYLYPLGPDWPSAGEFKLQGQLGEGDGVASAIGQL
jgi:hypothetical protein